MNRKASLRTGGQRGQTRTTLELRRKKGVEWGEEQDSFGHLQREIPVNRRSFLWGNFVSVITLLVSRLGRAKAAKPRLVEGPDACRKVFAENDVVEDYTFIDGGTIHFRRGQRVRRCVFMRSNMVLGEAAEFNYCTLGEGAILTVNVPLIGISPDGDTKVSNKSGSWSDPAVRVR